MTINPRTHYFILASFLIVFLIQGCNRTTSNSLGTYPTVQANDLVGRSTSQRTGQHDYNFLWSFDSESFKIDGTSIPKDLIQDLAIDDTASTISGTWELEDDTIILTTRNNGKSSETKMKIFATGPIRIQSTGAQYVF